MNQDPSGATHVPCDDPKDAIDQMFTYHTPTPHDEACYREIRGAALSLARIIDRCCPASADRTAAMRHLSDAVMTANASIARRGVSYR
jgi:hypothetical protein